MNNDYSYVGVPATTQEAMVKEDHEHPVETSETLTLAGPEIPAAPELSAPTVELKSLVMPVGTLILALILAVGHHSFNHWAAKDGRTVAQIAVVVPQHWVTRIGVAFAFGFKSVIGVTMAFVLLQCLWFSVARQPLTIQQIDTMYRIERQDQLYKTLPLAIFFSPTIVVFSAFTLLLPLSGVFAPGSLTIVNINSTNFGPCMIPTGNLSTPNTPDYGSLYLLDGIGTWGSVTPRATDLITQWFVGQHIPDLPQACGPNCRYNLSISSFVLQCTPNPSSLPLGQAGLSIQDYPGYTLWNGTAQTQANSSLPSGLGFYIAWMSNSGLEDGKVNGTSGNAYCSPVQAQYDVKVETKGGVQSVMTNITQTTSPIPDVRSNATLAEDSLNGIFWNQLMAITYATRALFLGSVSLGFSPGGEYFGDSRIASHPSFLDIPFGSRKGIQFVWGDVLKGIEEMSHNVTAGLLTLELGTMNSTCLFYQQDVPVYQYSSFDLWAPYSIALGIALISLFFAVVIMARNKTGHITTSFSDTAILARNMDEKVSAEAKLRLRAAEDGKLGYIFEPVT